MIETPRKKNSFLDYFAIGQVFTYWFRKPDPSRKTNFNIRTMHVINKISMATFLAGLIFIAVRAWVRG